MTNEQSTFCTRCENATELWAYVYIDDTEQRFCYECAFKHVGFDDKVARIMSLIYQLKAKTKEAE